MTFILIWISFWVDWLHKSSLLLIENSQSLRVHIICSQGTTHAKNQGWPHVCWLWTLRPTLATRVSTRIEL